jgi:hypothetical protein
MRIDPKNHLEHPWQVHELARGFRLEDVWALPTPGGPDDFPRLVELFQHFEPKSALFSLRFKLGALLGWDEPTGQSLSDRVPDGLERGPDAFQFHSLYLTGDEWALELSNQTMHGIVHLSWVPDGDHHRGELAVYVRRNGRFGAAYMAAITPFRYWIVYPAMMRSLDHAWRDFGVPGALTA